MKNLKILIMSVCLSIIAVGVIACNNSHQSISNDVDVYGRFFKGKGKEFIKDCVVTGSSDAIQKISVNGYDISLISSIYDKETQIGYFVFEIIGDISKIKEQNDLSVLLEDPYMKFKMVNISGAAGGKVSIINDKAYMCYECVVTDTDEEKLFIQVAGDEEVLGEFEVKSNTDVYKVKKLEENSKWKGVISPLGVRLSGKDTVGEKIGLIYKDGSREELLVTDAFYSDRNEDKVYVAVFDEIKDVEKVVSIAVGEEKYKLG